VAVCADVQYQVFHVFSPLPLLQNQPRAQKLKERFLVHYPHRADLVAGEFGIRAPVQNRTPIHLREARGLRCGDEFYSRHGAPIMLAIL